MSLIGREHEEMENVIKRIAAQLPGSIERDELEAILYTYFSELADLRRWHSAPVQGIPMILICPAKGCGERHIDNAQFAIMPHHTHSCQSCGFTWRPAVVPTVGVQFLPGFKDNE
jgi:hypothetical protein